MTHTETTTARKPHKRQERENPLGLFISVIREAPEAGQVTHRHQLRHLLLSSGYEDFLDAVIDEWQRIKYSTALRAAVPPTPAQIKERAAQRKQKAIQEEASVEKAKGLIGERLLEFTMPNGKFLRDCTGAECKQFGGLFTRIGKRVTNNRLVGDVLSAEQLARLSQKYANGLRERPE